MATIKDVADLAGVSTATVSHVINQTRYVAPETSERVWEAMQSLNYAPSAVARSLKLQSTNSIGMLVTTSSNPYFAEIVHSVEHYCQAKGYNLILSNTDYDVEHAQICLHMLLRKRIDGLLLMCTESLAGLSESLRQHSQLPVVVMDWGPYNPLSDRINGNSHQGGYLATRHLISLGHRRIACLTGPLHKQPAIERLAGYRQAMQDAGLSIALGWICEGNFDCESGYQAMKALLTLKPRPTAVFACNDLMAMGALRAAYEAHLHIPSQLSIIGYDNLSFTPFLTPPLTSIEQQKDDLARKAVTALIERIEHPGLNSRTYLLEPALVQRSSTGPFSQDME